MPENEFISSKTDTTGILTYVNALFIKYSGYTESELIGQQHNIVRHPDMPRVIFKLMWDTLKSKREFNGYIKNLNKNGSFYWVFANVTPNYSSDNELLGYYSVRRKPEADKLNYIQSLYEELLEIEQQSPAAEAINNSLYKLNVILNGSEKGYDEFILTI
jgi:PAS domain S-box-containing protein